MECIYIEEHHRIHKFRHSTQNAYVIVSVKLIDIIMITLTAWILQITLLTHSHESHATTVTSYVLLTYIVHGLINLVDVSNR
jgi:hypothetical protein